MDVTELQALNVACLESGNCKARVCRGTKTTDLVIQVERVLRTGALRRANQIAPDTLKPFFALQNFSRAEFLII